MSSHTKTVTARDLLGWAIEQGVFTDPGIRERETHLPVTNGVDGPWTEILTLLALAAAEAVADPMSGVGRGGSLDGFEEFVESTCLPRIIDDFALTEIQAGTVLALAEDVRLFFEGTVGIASGGFDGPIEGSSLRYHCEFDYQIEVPDWVSEIA